MPNLHAYEISKREIITEIENLSRMDNTAVHPEQQQQANNFLSSGKKVKFIGIYQNWVGNMDVSIYWAVHFLGHRLYPGKVPGF